MPSLPTALHTQAFVDENSHARLRELVSLEQLRPLPPPPPPDFVSALREGDPIEQLHEDGWWQAHAPGGQTHVLPTYKASHYIKVRSPPADLRWRSVLHNRE